MACCNQFMDKTEPLFWTVFVLCVVGIIVTSVQRNEFEIAVAVGGALASGVAAWRVRSLAGAKSLQESLMGLEEENAELKYSVTKLKEENVSLGDNVTELEKTVKKFQDLVGIVDTRNKTGKQIQRELFEMIDQYRREIKRLERENDRLEKNNKLALFFTVDADRDGKLGPGEAEELTRIMKQEYNIEYAFDTNGDGVISRKELMDRLYGNPV